MSEEEKPVIKDGKRGQILRFGEHDIRLIRRELHLAVDEELRFTPEEKEIRKQLMDKVEHKLLFCIPASTVSPTDKNLVSFNHYRLSWEVYHLIL